jgi:isopropylmalate/homocitrate/citramalate synthase
MLIHPAIYQFIPPADLGADIEYVYGKHSGTMVIEYALRSAGIEAGKDLVQQVMGEVKKLREERAAAGDFSGFQDAYYSHLEGMGVSADEVTEIARALLASRAT